MSDDWRGGAVALEEDESAEDWRGGAIDTEVEDQGERLHKAALKHGLEWAAPHWAESNWKEGRPQKLIQPPKKYGERTEEDYGRFASEVAQELGVEKTGPEFVKAIKPYLDAADWAGDPWQGGLQNKLPPEELRPFVLSAAQEVYSEFDKRRKPGWGARTAGLAVGGIAQIGEAINALKPFQSKDQKEWEAALTDLATDPRRFVHPDQGFVSRNVMQLAGLVPKLGVAAAAGGTPGVGLAFGLPTGVQVKRQAEARGATEAAAIAAGVGAGGLETLLFSKLPKRVLGQLGGKEAARQTYAGILGKYALETAKTGGVMKADELQARLAEEGAVWVSGQAGADAGKVFREAVESLPDTAFQAAILHVPGLVRGATGPGSPWQRSEALRNLRELHPLQQRARMESKEWTRQWVAENPEAALQLAQFDQPTRRQWEEAGLSGADQPGGINQRFRRNFVVRRLRPLLEPIVPPEATREGPAAPSPPPEDVARPLQAPPEPVAGREAPAGLSFETEGPLRKLLLGGKEIGETNVTPAEMSPRGDVEKAFPGLLGDAPVRLLNGIIIPETEHRRQGYGQALFLDALAQEPGAWLYSSQLDAPAVPMMRALVDKGLIELAAKDPEKVGLIYRVPPVREGQDMGPWMARLTPKGIEEANRLGVPQPATESTVERPESPPEAPKVSGAGAVPPPPIAPEGTPETPAGRVFDDAAMAARRETLGQPPREKPEPRGWDVSTQAARERSEEEVSRVVDELQTRSAASELEEAMVERRANDVQNRLVQAQVSGNAQAIGAAEGEMLRVLKAVENAPTESARILGRRRAIWDEDMTFMGVTRRRLKAKGEPLTEAERTENAQLVKEVAEKTAALEQAEARERQKDVEEAIAEARREGQRWRRGREQEANWLVGELAREHGVTPQEVQERAKEMAEAEAGPAREYNQALADAMKRTSLTPKKAEKWEESGKDSSTWPDLDKTARELAAEYPVLELGGRGYEEGTGYDPTDYAGALWRKIKEGPHPEPQWQDQIEVAGAYFARSRPAEAAVEERGDTWEAQAETEAGDFPWEEPTAGRPMPQERASPTREKAAREPRKGPSKQAVRQEARDSLENLGRILRAKTAAFFKQESGAFSPDVDADFLEAVGRAAKAHVQLGVLTFNEFMGKLRDAVGDVADRARGNIKFIWDDLRERGEIRLTPPEGKELSKQDIARLAKRVAGSAVAGGIEKPVELLAAVHEDLQGVMPGITQEQVIDALRSRGEFGLKKKVLTKEQVEARYAKAEAETKVKRMLQETEWKARTPVEKLLGATPDILNASRAILTSFDWSAVLRQGLLVTASHPEMMIRALPDMFKATFSRKAGFAAAENIRERPGAKSGLYDEAGLPLVDTEGGLERMEEAYMGHWLKHVPEWMVKTSLGKKLSLPVRGLIEGVAGSERAYITFLNRVRADLFDSMTATLGKGGTITLEEAKAIANYVGVVTGRGSLGPLQKHATLLATLFFSPRFVASRFQFLFVQPLWTKSARTSPRVQILIAKEYGRILIGLGTFYGSLIMAKYLLGIDDDTFKIGLNPTKSDFLKLRFRNHYRDPLAGLSQTTVFLARAGQNLSEVLRGKRPTDPTYHLRFLQQKLSPWLGAAVESPFGEHAYDREPITAVSMAKRNLIPITVRQILTEMKGMGMPAKSAGGLLEIFGSSGQTYGPATPMERRLSEIYEKRNEYLESIGKGQDNVRYPASPIRPMREAVVAGDREAFKKAKAAYLASGKNVKSFTASLQRLDPVHSKLNDADELEFRDKFLSAEDRAKLKTVQSYAAELRQRMIEWWKKVK